MSEVQEDLLTEVRDAVDWEPLLGRNRAVLCGLSGGPDSVALIDLLDRLRIDLDFRLYAAHLNHGLRGADSGDDEEFVREFCASRKIELDVERANVGGYVTGSDRSVEMAARSARYEFFGRAAARAGLDIVTLGHTANDRVENLLMRLLRGSGGRGLGSLRGVRFHFGLTFVRPLLEIFRYRILLYLEWRKLEYRIDRTNLDENTDRGRIRNYLLPGLLDLAEDSGWESVLESLARSASLLSDDEAFIDGLVDEYLPEVSTDESGALHLPKSILGCIPSPILARLILSVVQNVDPVSRIEREHIEGIIDMLRGARTVACDIPGGFRVEPAGDDVVIRKPREDAINPPDPVDIAVGKLPVNIKFGPFEVEISVVKAGAKRTLTNVEPSQDGVWISIPGGCESVRIRSVQPGDRIAPMGREGHTKKVSDIFVDNRVPREARAFQPVVEASPGGDIIALPGLKIVSEIAKVTEESDPVIEITVRGHLAGHEDVC